MADKRPRISMWEVSSPRKKSFGQCELEKGGMEAQLKVVSAGPREGKRRTATHHLLVSSVDGNQFPAGALGGEKIEPERAEVLSERRPDQKRSSP